MEPLRSKVNTRACGAARSRSIPTAVEELLRYDPPAQPVIRTDADCAGSDQFETQRSPIFPYLIKPKNLLRPLEKIFECR
jgi:hypothetical protein